MVVRQAEHEALKAKLRRIRNEAHDRGDSQTRTDAAVVLYGYRQASGWVSAANRLVLAGRITWEELG